MSTFTDLRSQLRLPVVGSPMFIASGPELVKAQCQAGIIGSFPTLNARPASLLTDWLDEISESNAAHTAANPSSLPLRTRSTSSSTVRTIASRRTSPRWSAIRCRS